MRRMETKTIKWFEEFTKLFPESTERKLEDNHKWCDKCNGVGWIRKDIYISSCVCCSGRGQIELCNNGCGKEKDRYYSYCRECNTTIERDKQSKKENERFCKAEKIQYKDYDGKFLVGSDDFVKTKEDFEEWIYEQLSDGYDIKPYTYALNTSPVLDLNIYDGIESECADNGYEDMYSRLDISGLNEIQALIDLWIEKQGESNLIYNEDYKKVVLLDEIIEEIRNEMKTRS